MPKRGKKYQEAAKLIDRQNLYEIEEAVDLAVKAAPAKRLWKFTLSSA